MAGGKIRQDSAISIKPISITGSRRIIKHAFDYAIENGRKKVTAVAKANIMKYTDGLFYEVGREVAKEYEGRVEYDEWLVDAMCMQLVQKPENYDVLVMENLYGDILSDLCAGLVGGLGVAPGANIGDDTALFEATHGSAPKYKNQNKVNPTALILSGLLMLQYLKEDAAAARLETRSLRGHRRRQGFGHLRHEARPQRPHRRHRREHARGLPPTPGAVPPPSEREAGDQRATRTCSTGSTALASATSATGPSAANGGRATTWASATNGYGLFDLYDDGTFDHRYVPYGWTTVPGSDPD